MPKHLMRALVPAAALAVALIAGAGPASASVPGPLGLPGPWTLTHNETPADLETWGNPYGAGPNSADEDVCYSRANISIGSAGNLDLAVIAKACTMANGNPASYTGVYLQSPWTQRYGVYEARIWLPETAAGKVLDWPAFWLVDNSAPPLVDNEADILEGGYAAGLNSATFHYGTQGYGASDFYAGVPGWHVYGLRWTPTVERFYLDGRQILMVNTHVWHTPETVVLNYTSFGGRAYQDTPGAMRVAWVRTWLG